MLCKVVGHAIDSLFGLIKSEVSTERNQVGSLVRAGGSKCRFCCQGIHCLPSVLQILRSRAGNTILRHDFQVHLVLQCVGLFTKRPSAAVVKQTIQFTHSEF